MPTAIETERLVQAAEVESSVSFNDRLCLVACREEGWTCVTNDGALRRLCDRYGVETRFGLGLMVDLVAAGAVTKRRAVAVARQIQASNPLHINERVLARFLAALETQSLRRRGERADPVIDVSLCHASPEKAWIRRLAEHIQSDTFDGQPDGRPLRLDPGVREVPLAVPAEEEHPCDGGYLLPWWAVTRRRVSRSARWSLRTGANDSEATRKSRASESSSGGCSSKASPLAKRPSSSTSSRSARRLVEPTRT